MIRFICSVFSFTLFFGIFSQNNDFKKVQVGIVFCAGTNFSTPQTNLISRDGIGSNLTLGINFNYNYTATLGFHTGLEFDFETVNYKSNSTALTSAYYLYNDTDILSKKEYLDANGIESFPLNSKLFQIHTRKNKSVYLTIPTMLLFKTEPIGELKVFCKFGLRNSFLLSNTIFDNGEVYNDFLDGSLKNSSSINSNMKSSSRELAIYKGCVGIAGGVDWNFIGSTSLVAELGYYYGLFNISRSRALVGDSEKNMSVFSDLNSNLTPKLFSNLPSKQNQLLLKVAILF